MNDKFCSAISGVHLLIEAGANLSVIQVIDLVPDSMLLDYQAAMKLANKEAQQQLGEMMLLSWYDRDRDFESPQHSSECLLDSAISGYVDYGISHGAKLMIDIENGRFIFFYMPMKL